MVDGGIAANVGLAGLNTRWGDGRRRAAGLGGAFGAGLGAGPDLGGRLGIGVGAGPGLRAVHAEKGIDSGCRQQVDSEPQHNFFLWFRIVAKVPPLGINFFAGVCEGWCAYRHSFEIRSQGIILYGQSHSWLAEYHTAVCFQVLGLGVFNQCSVFRLNHILQNERTSAES